MSAGERVGVLLFYARAVDSSMLVALGAISAAQSKATQDTGKAVNQLLDYAATHPNATIEYRASAMYLWTHSDASYLSAARARSRCSDFHFHDLRHEATCRFYETTTLTDVEVSLITGHKDLRMLRRYANLRGSHLARRIG